jgi:putative FmdB family regulatory protein
MPVYEYLCSSCKEKFEKLLPMSDGLLMECPTCDTESPRVLSVFAAFSATSEGIMKMVNGGGCACASGGACNCAGGF